MINVGQYTSPMDPMGCFFTCPMTVQWTEIFSSTKPLRSLLRLGHEIRLGQTGVAMMWKIHWETAVFKPLNILKGVGVKIFMR